MLRIFIISCFVFILQINAQNDQSSKKDFNKQDIIADTVHFEPSSSGASWKVSQKEISNLPFRGVQNILLLYPEFVIQDREAHLRGSRPGEMGYYLEGMSVRDPVSGALHDLLIDEAIDKIEVDPGYFDVRYGNAVAGIIRQTMRTGGDVFSTGIKYRGEPVKAGTDLSGSYASGYQNFVFEAQGPLLDKNMHFFFIHEYQYRADSNPRFYSPFSFTNQVADIGFRGEKDTLDVNWEGRLVPKNSLEINRGNGNISFSGDKVRGKIIFAYLSSKQRNNYAPIYTLFNSRSGFVSENELLISGKMNYLLNKNIKLDFQVGYWNNKKENNDDVFGSQYRNWYDVDKNAEHGILLADRSSRNMNIHGFLFLRDDYPVYDEYFKQKTESFSFSTGTKWKFNKRLTLKADLDYQSYIIRYYSLYAPGFASLIDPPFGQEYDRQYYANILDVNNYGYDVFGNESDDGLDSPKEPSFGGLSISAVYKKNKVNISAGLRVDYLNGGTKIQKNPENPLTENGVIIASAYMDADPEIKFSPRFSLFVPFNENFRAYTNFGVFYQLSRGSERYIGNSAQSKSYTEMAFIRYPVNPIDTKAIRSKNFEAGVCGEINSKSSFRFSVFNHLTDNQSAPTQIATNSAIVLVHDILASSTYSISDGVNLAVLFAPSSEVFGGLEYTYTNARGQYSSEYEAVAPLEQGTALPTVLYPLRYNRKHRGRIFLNIKFNQKRGALLGGTGLYAIYHFSSGHPYTTAKPLIGPYTPSEASVRVENDIRSLQPTIPINGATSFPQRVLDLRIDKDFRISDRLQFKIFLDVENFFNNKYEENIYMFSGLSTTDNMISYTLSNKESIIAQYGEEYIDYYREINDRNAGSYSKIIQNEMWNTPRQFRLGIELLY